MRQINASMCQGALFNSLFKEVAIEKEFKIYPQDDSESPKDLAGNCESRKASWKHLDNFP